jgi:hypothetical protein
MATVLDSKKCVISLGQKPDDNLSNFCAITQSSTVASSHLHMLLLKDVLRECSETPQLPNASLTLSVESLSFGQ